MTLIAMLVGVAVAVVVIDSGDEEGTKQPSVEQQVSPVDELPPGLRELLVQRHLDLDRVRSVECGAGRQAPVKLRSSFVPLVQLHRSGVEKVAGEPRPVGKVCRTELRPSGVNVSAKFGDEWVQVVAFAAVAGGSSDEVRDESGNAVGISECPEATEAFQRASVPVPTAYAHKCPSRSRIEELIPRLRLVLRDMERLGVSTSAQATAGL